jgi:hypothetical protein
MRLTRARGLGMALGLLLAAACGDGTTTTGPSPTTPESSFLSGTWSGPVTLHREGLPDTTGTSTWTFVLMPGTSGTTFTTTLTVAHPYLPITATVSTSLNPAAPGGHISTIGFYASPRGCQGDVHSAGTAQTDRIEATFAGSDCVPSSDGPVAFTGSVSLTKVR